MILTRLHRLKDAIRFKNYNGGSTFLLFGGLTAWDNESIPPTPDPNENTTIPDCFGAAPATVRWVKEDDVAGTYAVLGTDGNLRKFAELTTEEDVLAWDGDIFVLLQATVLGSNIPDGISFYRQLGFTTNPTISAGHTTDSFILAANMPNNGDLETLEWRRPYPVNPGSQQDFFEIIQY